VIFMARIKREKIQGYISAELKEWVLRMVTKGTFRSEAHAVEQGLLLKKAEIEGTLLTK